MYVSHTVYDKTLILDGRVHSDQKPPSLLLRDQIAFLQPTISDPAFYEFYILPL